MSRKLLLACLSIALLTFAMASAACGDDDDATATPTAAPTVAGTPTPNPDVADIVDVMTKLATTDGATITDAETDYYLGHVTDTFLQDFGTADSAACAADIANCVGDPLPNVTIDEEGVEVTGDSAILVMNSDNGSFGIKMAKEGGIWKANGVFVPDDDVSGKTVIDMSLVDFGFDYDMTDAAVTGGDFALHIKNDGQQAHEVVLVPLGEDTRPLEEILQDQAFSPNPVFVKLPFAPGSEADVAVPEALAPGRYAFVCFFPDTTDAEGTPHAFKGMTSEFNVTP